MLGEWRLVLLVRGTSWAVEGISLGRGSRWNPSVTVERVCEVPVVGMGPWTCWQS
jgi:hypothetical protein